MRYHTETVKFLLTLVLLTLAAFAVEVTAQTSSDRLLPTSVWETVVVTHKQEGRALDIQVRNSGADWTITSLTLKIDMGKCVRPGKPSTPCVERHETVRKRISPGQQIEHYLEVKEDSVMGLVDQIWVIEARGYRTAKPTRNRSPGSETRI